MIYRYYKDKEYRDWILITEGTKPERTYFKDFITLARSVDLTDVERINSPDDSNPEWYIDEKTRHWRREPPRKPSLMREIIHIVPGAFTGALLWVGSPEFIAAAVILLIGFLAYEITEGFRIKDLAYRDIHGFLFGFGAVMLAKLGLVVFNAFST